MEYCSLIQNSYPNLINKSTNPTQSMQRKTEAITNPTVKPMRFWSNGNISRTAFNRIVELKSEDRAKEASSMLSEWLLD